MSVFGHCCMSVAKPCAWCIGCVECSHVLGERLKANRKLSAIHFVMTFNAFLLVSFQILAPKKVILRWKWENILWKYWLNEEIWIERLW